MSTPPRPASTIVMTQAAADVCNQLSQGADESAVAKSLPAKLPTVSKKQAPLFVGLAQKHYC